MIEMVISETAVSETDISDANEHLPPSLIAIDFAGFCILPA